MIKGGGKPIPLFREEKLELFRHEGPVGWFTLLVILLALFVLVSCGKKETFHHGDYWVHVAEPCSTYRWVQLTSVNSQEFFGLRYPASGGKPAPLRLLAGTVRPESPEGGVCVIYSVLDELTAMHAVGPYQYFDAASQTFFQIKYMDGWSVWDHEVKGHAFSGDDHPEVK